MVLTGENLGWRHQRRLAAALDRGQHRDQRDDRLAAADIPLEQPHHAPRLRHFRRDLGDRETLRAGQRKAERRFDRAGQGAGTDDRPTLLSMATGAHQRHR